LTDNKNRTAPEVRSAFTKFGGSLGEANSVSFQFDHVGYILYERKSISEDEMLESAIEAGANDLICSENFEIICSIEQLSSVRDKLIQKFGDPLEAKVVWLPKNTVSIHGDNVKTLFKLIEALEDNDDVQSVITNCDIPEEFTS
jgi:YebC/PmpR family DNA-binding regulatory protein